MDKERYLAELEVGLIEQGEKEADIRTCCLYAENLLDHDLPVIFDIMHFSLLLGMSEKKLVAYIWGDESKLYSIREIPKKNGKSELGAAIALNMLCNDDEWRAEVYS